MEDGVLLDVLQDLKRKDPDLESTRDQLGVFSTS
jgi:hypothetical protein